MSIGEISQVEGGHSRTVRELLDDSRANENSDHVRSRSFAQHARVLARANMDQQGEAEALYRLARAAHASGRADEAFGLALEARDLATACHTPAVAVWSLNLLASVHYAAGNYSAALSSALEALDLYRTTGERSDEGNLLNTVAVVYHSLGDIDRAIVSYEAALTSNRELDRPDFDATTLFNMAKLRADRGEYLLAVGLASNSLELVRSCAPERVPQVLALVADAYVALGMLGPAEDTLAEAQVIMAGDTLGPADRPLASIELALVNGRMKACQDRYDEALDIVEEALATAMDADLPELALRSRALLAQMCKEAGHFARALDHQEARFRLHEELFNRGADLRVKTLQIAHETAAARIRADSLGNRSTELEGLVRARTREMETHHLASFVRLAATVSASDAAAIEHGEQVGEYASIIAAEIGAPHEYIEQIRVAARLHDVGMILMPHDVVLKPGPLTAGEYDNMKSHAALGAEILSGNPSPLFQLATEIAMSHHERWDGSGYPVGLQGSNVPLSGRIVAIADAFDTLIGERWYKQASSTVAAIHRIIEGSGAEFEPRLVEAFVSAMIRRDPDLAGQLGRPTHS